MLRKKYTMKKIIWRCNPTEERKR